MSETWINALRVPVGGSSSGGGGSVAWGDITGRPSSFTPSAHEHAISEVTGLGGELAALDAEIALKADAAAVITALSGKADLSHAHAISDVTGLTAALAGKQATVLAGTVTVSVDNGAMEALQTFAAVGLTGASRVFVTLGTMLDAVENSAEMLDILSIGAAPGTDTLTVQMAFITPQSGAIPVNWSVI